MAKINQYPAKTVPSNNDEFVLHDPASGSTKKMTRGDLIGGAPLPAKSVTIPAINGGTTAGVLTTDASGNVTANPFPMFTGWRTTDIAAPSDDWTVIPVNVVDYDNYSAYSTGTGIYTIPKNGMYTISGNILGTFNQGETLFAGSRLNSADDIIGSRAAKASSGAGDLTGGFSITRKYSAGDKVNLGVFHNTGGSKNIIGTKAGTYYSIACVALI